jgi:uncharacterized membrane protein YphA (DoxX/SURF4 family)
MLNDIQLYITYFLQVAIAITLINVWLVHFSKPTKYRGKGAKNMLNEFKAYGLPEWFMYLVGTLKLIIASCLIIGIWIPVFVFPATFLLAILMIGAIYMHLKVRDSFKRTAPATILLLITLILMTLTLS